MAMFLNMENIISKNIIWTLHYLKNHSITVIPQLYLHIPNTNYHPHCLSLRYPFTQNHVLFNYDCNLYLCHHHLVPVLALH